jgi:ribosomal protein S18 acetylase RimI-like enzyme
MKLEMLDNPGWHALSSYHRHLAVRGKIAARYQPGILSGGGMPENSTAGLDDLRTLVEIDETITVLGPLPGELVGWQVLHKGWPPQMVCENLKPKSHVDAVDLSEADVPEMLDLVALAQPGPFQPRTIETGNYLGLRRDGKLVAMAGERLHLTSFCEISAVCTHPNYRGRGYASALTTMVAEGILSRGEVPFLHIAATNDVARKLYSKLGFRLRKELQLYMLQRVS